MDSLDSRVSTPSFFSNSVRTGVVLCSGVGAFAGGYLGLRPSSMYSPLCTLLDSDSSYLVSLANISFSSLTYVRRNLMFNCFDNFRILLKILRANLTSVGNVIFFS